MLFIALVWSQDTERTVCVHVHMYSNMYSNNSNMYRHTQVARWGVQLLTHPVQKNLGASLVAQLVKNPPAMQETPV